RAAHLYPGSAIPAAAAQTCYAAHPPPPGRDLADTARSNRSPRREVASRHRAGLLKGDRSSRSGTPPRPEGLAPPVANWRASALPPERRQGAALKSGGTGSSRRPWLPAVRTASLDRLRADPLRELEQQAPLEGREGFGVFAGLAQGYIAFRPSR